MRSIEDLVEINELDKAKVSHRFTHRIVKVKKKPLSFTLKFKQKYLNLWYLKTNNDSPGDDEDNSDSDQDDSGSTNDETSDKNPIYEVIAQELLRLLIPRQPKTRLVYDEENEKYYVISKHVQGYCSLELVNKVDFREGIKSGKFTGLGEILVVALLLNEIDLKFGNVCVNEHNQIIKIDGDKCFARIIGFQNKKYTITERDIAGLPFIKDYYAYNWLDLIEYEMIGKGKFSSVKKIPKMIDAEICANPLFRAEVNRTIFKLLILPDDLLDDFITSYAERSSITLEIYEELLERKNQLLRAAIHNQSFCDFLGSMEAVQAAHIFVEQLRAFKTTGKNTLPMKKYESRVIHNYLDLRARVANEVKPRRSSRFKGTLFAANEGSHAGAGKGTKTTRRGVKNNDSEAISKRKKLSIP